MRRAAASIFLCWLLLWGMASTALADGSPGFIQWTSQAGDPLLQGTSGKIDQSSGVFEAGVIFSNSFDLTFRDNSNPSIYSWRFTFAPALGQPPLAPGAYENALASPDPVHPLMRISVAVNGLSAYDCGTIGRFVIYEISFDAHGFLDKLAVDFEHHCLNVVPAAYGAVRFNSAVPYTAPQIAPPVYPVPTGLTATASGTSRVNLSWNDSGAFAYAVYRDGVFAGGQVAGATSLAVTALSPATTYSFTIKGCDAANNCSAPSSPVSATTARDTQPPNDPTGVTATTVGPTEIALAWNASTDDTGVAQYNVYQDSRLVYSTSMTTASIVNLAPSTSYKFWVTACDATGNCSVRSATVSATTLPAGAPVVPGVPTGLVGQPLGTTQVTLAWNAPALRIGSTVYRVYVAGIIVGAFGATNATVSGLLPGTTYQFQVAACNANGCSSLSPSVAVTTNSSVPSGGCGGLQPPDDFLAFNCLPGQTGFIYQVRSYSYCVPPVWTPVLDPLVTNTCTAAATVSSYQDLWWAGAQENGWGLTITQHDDALFLAWYIYDANGNPQWVVMTTGTWDAAHTTYSGSLYIPTSSPFSSYDASHFSAGNPVGTASITFTSGSAATFNYTVNGVSGSKSIARQEFGRVDMPMADYTDMWWGGTSQDGWGVVLTQQYSNIFATWFTYDATGKTVWYVMTDGAWSGTTFSGTLYTTHGAPVIGAAYDPSRLVLTQVGTLSLSFSSASSGTMTYTVNGLTQTKSIARLPF